MKKFVFLYYGYGSNDQGTMEQWQKWFESIGDKLVDGGNPFGSGREIVKGEGNDLTPGSDTVTGYSIVNVHNMDEAEKIAKGCPGGLAVRIYEALPM